MFHSQLGEVVDRPQNGLSSITVTLFENEGGILHYDDMENVTWDVFEEELDTVIIPSVFQALNVGQDDRIGLVIRGFDQQGTPIQMALNFRYWYTMTADDIIRLIINVLSSSQSLVLDNLEFVFTRMHVDNINELAGNPKRDIPFNRYLENKRCLIEIRTLDAASKDCIYQLFILGLAFLGRHHTWLPKWDYLIKSRNRDQTRSKAAAKMKELLGEPADVKNAILKFEAAYNIQVCLFSVERYCTVVYPSPHALPIEDGKEVVFGVVNEAFDHVDFVTHPWRLASEDGVTGRCCPNCFQLYQKKKSCSNKNCLPLSRCCYCHRCSNACPTCLTKSCGFMDDVHESSYSKKVITQAIGQCRACNFQFYSVECETLHSMVCDSFLIRAKRCSVCERAEHRGLHCDETRCLLCDEKRKFEDDGSHVCWMKREKLPKMFNRYWVYDFECALDEKKHHVPYLCTAWPMYPLTTDERGELGIFESREVADYPYQPMFVFAGLGDRKRKKEGVYRFFEMLEQACIQNTQWFAHNSGRYDAIVLDKIMFEKGWISNKFQRGCRIMQMIYPSLDITFKDSLSFIPTSLRSMSSDFDIAETTKGFFPHNIVTVQYLQYAQSVNYWMPKPRKEDFSWDFRPGKAGDAEKKELLEFCSSFLAQPYDLWNVMETAILYCISDTLLLGKVLTKFRNTTMEMTDKIPRAQDVAVQSFDPLYFVTLPSAVMKLYMSQFLPLQTIAVLDRYTYETQREAKLWMLYMESILEVTIDDPPFVIDLPISGISREGNKVFVFWECYDNGCPQCFPGNGRNYRRGVRFQQCYQWAKRKENEVYTAFENCEIYTTWSHSFDKYKKSVDFMEWFHRFEDEIEERLPIDPREAYKGGVSEMYKMRAPKISMSDFVSQYPTVLIGESVHPVTNVARQFHLPTGQPEITKYPLDINWENASLCGIVKCKVLVPQNLYAPFLGYKTPSRIVKGTYEVLYGCCRLCMRSRITTLCNHSEEERSFSGTWTIAEIRYAVTELGYKVKTVYEIWKYPSSSNDLFKKFILPFMITKIYCKKAGLVDGNGQFTDQGSQVAQYIEELTGEIVLPSNFSDSPASRTIAKLIMNSFYGKWGQRSVWPESRAFSESEEHVSECAKLLSDPSLDITSAEVVKVNEMTTVIVEFQKRSAVSKGDRKKNDHIAAHVTAWGRIMLHQMVHHLGNNMIYVDTDSLLHLHMPELSYSTGFRTGDLELELPEATNWEATARKGYKYDLPDGRSVVKMKGIMLSQACVSSFANGKMLNLARDNKRKWDEFCESNQDLEVSELVKRFRKSVEDRPSIDVEQTYFQTVRENKLTANKVTLSRMKKTLFLAEAMKRIPIGLENLNQDIIDTVPFGYIKPSSRS